VIRRRPGIFTVVLTGGIASGKTAVSELFGELGVPIIDTDCIARELVEPGRPALLAIVDAFGPECLDANGRLDRRAMRSLIFSDPAAKARLEGILHPLIQAEVNRRASGLASDYCIVVIPLYAGSGAYDRVDRVLVVDADEDTQISRVMKRDRITRESAEAILENQIDRRRRLALADDIIVNEDGFSELKQKVRNLHSVYLSIARRRASR
jgi:dephospho-CoA kinase